MAEIFMQVLQVGFFAALIRIATPLILATIGELYAERAGVLNLGIEGTMLFGAMTGFTTAYFTGSLWLGVAAASLGSVVPALDTARAPPAQALKAGDETRAFSRPPSSLPGLVAIALGTLASLLPPIAGLPLAGYFAIALLRRRSGRPPQKATTLRWSPSCRR